MALNWLDYAVIGLYMLFVLGVGFALRKRAGSSMAEFFISGRSLPWWLLGTSMVATTFAADTPLAVVGLTAESGLAGNWFWWAMATGGMITVFVYARLWRRSEVMTDVELVELRYGGKPASILRGFRALYFAIPINCIVIGWVVGAMLTILRGTVLHGVDAGPYTDWLIIIGLLVIVGVYSAMSGLWGVTVTDFVQFFIAMAGCIVLAWLAVGDAGGTAALRDSVNLAMGGEGVDAFRFLPDFTAAEPLMAIDVFLIYLFVLWWASWYPGAEPGGGGYIVQRMASAKDEKNALLGTLWFQVAHYCVRPWPWLIVAFAAIAKYPELMAESNKGIGFAWIMRDLLPAGLRGLLLVVFFAAFMSTLSTQVNWGASYLVNDFYKRFMKPGATERELTGASRVATILVLILAGLTAYAMRHISVDQAWRILAALGAGTGAVYMLRWFWWRINAWSEISAMVAAAVYYSVLTLIAYTSDFSILEERKLVIVAALTVVTWLLVTFLTPAEKPEVLDRFFTKVRPGGPGWRAVAARLGTEPGNSGLGLSLVCAVLGMGIVYMTLPAVGALIFGDYFKGFLLLIGAGACAAGITVLLNRMGWERILR